MKRKQTCTMPPKCDCDRAKEIVNNCKTYLKNKSVNDQAETILKSMEDAGFPQYNLTVKILGTAHYFQYTSRTKRVRTRNVEGYSPTGNSCFTRNSQTAGFVNWLCQVFAVQFYCSEQETLTLHIIPCDKNGLCDQTIPPMTVYVDASSGVQSVDVGQKRRRPSTKSTSQRKRYNTQARK